MMSSYDLSVFINYPFDPKYKLSESLIFVIHDCGFIARSALEFLDADQVRIDKIMRLISKCGLGVHDISWTELDTETRLPRFNMPLELGIFLGAKWLGTKKQKKKRCLVFDREEFRYQKFCSDIAGQDITAHYDEPRRVIRAVRNWLSTIDAATILPGGKRIFTRYEQFTEDLPLYCDVFKQDPDELTFTDYSTLVSTWLEEHSW